MPHQLTTGSLEKITSGATDIDKPILQLLSSKKITSSGNADRYRLLLSDGEHTYSRAMLATQMNYMIENSEMDNFAVIRVDKYLSNTIQPDSRVMIILDATVLSPGSEVGVRLGNPQPFRAGAPGSTGDASKPTQDEPANKPYSNNNVSKPSAPYNPAPQSTPYTRPAPSTPANLTGRLPAGSPGTPGGGRIHSIASLTPYQNRWRIRARVTGKSGIRTWSNSRGEGKLFSATFTDESGEIRATAFKEAVDKYYDMLEMNKIFYVSRGTLKTANKQYSTVKNDYEMTFNADTCVEPCEEDVDLPCLQFDFVKINELDSHQAQSTLDVIGVVKTFAECNTVTGRQSNREIIKRDITIVDQSGMSVNLTLWGTDAEKFNGENSPVIAVKGCKLSDFGGRSLSVLGSSQVFLNPDMQEAHLLKGWFDHDGVNMDFTGYKRDGAEGGFSTNWKTFEDMVTENLGSGEKPDYLTVKGTVLFIKKENCMYQACPTEQCNKKVIDQNNGLYRCEKCNKEFPNFKWRLLLNANLGDFGEGTWATFFQDTAEALLGRTAEEIGNLRENNEVEFENLFQQALFKSYIFKLRVKMENYNDESRVKCVCMTATPVDPVDYGKHLVEEITKLIAA